MPKDTFRRIHKEKQIMILDVAAKEFATHGFHKANINVIASNAGISVGAMYRYFKSKKDLFSETLENGLSMLRTKFNNVMEADLDPFSKIRLIFEIPVRFVKEKPSYLNLYINLLSGGMDDFVKQYAHPIEKVGSDFFKRIIQDGIKKGLIDKDIDVNAFSFFLDNHLMMFTFSHISLYLKIRQDEFMGGYADPEYIIDATIRICEKIMKVEDHITGVYHMKRL
ncbi:MAG: TetR/AcrR family transcriptional regulator [Deltaproteobacteria bacterium]|nr:TetR/AcrR family transcriptional regulator [Deltaproteobacteria bacterium]